MTFVAIVDFETSGVNTDTDIPVECSAIIYDTDRRLYVRTYEAFFGYPQQPEKQQLCRELSKIHPEYPAAFPSTEGFRELIAGAESGVLTHFIAFNAPFDESFFHKACQQLGLVTPRTPWICARRDLPWHLHDIRPGKLIHAAAELGILNPFPHRALSDCLTTMLILQKFDWQTVLDYYEQPNRRLIAQVSFAEKDLAKAAGFSWHSSQRFWYKDVRGSVGEYPFKIVVEEMP